MIFTGKKIVSKYSSVMQICWSSRPVYHFFSLTPQLVSHYISLRVQAYILSLFTSSNYLKSKMVWGFWEESQEAGLDIRHRLWKPQCNVCQMMKDEALGIYDMKTAFAFVPTSHGNVQICWHLYWSYIAKVSSSSSASDFFIYPVVFLLAYS